MARDGATKSLWQDTISSYKPVTRVVDSNRVYDALIVGGGITGLTTALQLQAAGKQCVVAEAFNIGFGTTGGTTAHLNTVLDTPYYDIESKFSTEAARLVALAARDSIRLIEELCGKYNIECGFKYLPGYLFAQNDEEARELDKIQESAARAGINIAYAADVPTAVPYITACVFEGQAQFDIGKYLIGLAMAFENEGGTVLENCLVTAAASGDHHTATTALGDIKANAVIYATHIPPGINLLHFRCAAYRTYAAAITLKDDNYPEALVYDMEDPYHYFRTQEVEGKKYMIAGGYDHKTGDNVNTEQPFRELHAYLNKYYNIDEVVYHWSSQYYNSVDGLPYIGKLPGHDTIYTGTGYLGNGMIFGTLTGKIVSDMISGKENAYEQLFSPGRIKPIAGFTEFVKENASVVSKFISMRFSYEQLNGLVDLAPGYAMLADYKGAKIALYKDDNGKLYALDPVCPHAKCIVAWNNAEKTWDCPCHGGRYAVDGTLLTGPARKGLAAIQLEDL